MRSYKIIPGSVSLSRVKDISFKARKRLDFLDYWHNHNKNVSLTIRHFGISYETFYLWQKRFNPYNLQSLESWSTRPHRMRPMEVPDKYQDLVVEIRRNDVEKSKYEITEELKRQGVFLSPSTVQKIINRKSHIYPELLNTHYRKMVKRYKNHSIPRLRADRFLKEKSPGFLVQIDTKHLYVLGRRFYQFTAIDTKTRLSFSQIFATGSSLNGALFLERLQEYFPFKIQAIQTDNGSEYLLNFHHACKIYGIIHYFTYPNCPKQNGRVERMIQTSEYEFWLHQEDLLPKLDVLQERILFWNHKYNTLRLHQSLGYKTPVEYLNQFNYYLKEGNSTECM